MMRDDYGFKGRRENLISKEAQKGVGADNPYDPEVIDDPDVKCFPVEELTEAEAAFDEIKEYESREGEGRQVTILDDFGRQIDAGNKWLFEACDKLRKEAQFYTDLVIIFQHYNARLPILDVCTHVSFAKKMLMYKNLSWTKMMNLGTTFR